MMTKTIQYAMLVQTTFLFVDHGVSKQSSTPFVNYIFVCANFTPVFIIAFHF